MSLQGVFVHYMNKFEIHSWQFANNCELDVDLVVKGLSSVTDLLRWSDAWPILCYALLSLLRFRLKYSMLCFTPPPPKVYRSIGHASLKHSNLVKISNTVLRLSFTKVFSSKYQWSDSKNDPILSFNDPIPTVNHPVLTVFCYILALQWPYWAG